METGHEPAHLYRFGFLVSNVRDGFRTRPNERWHQRDVGGLAILLHEETEFRHVASPTGSATVLGPVFAIGAGDVDGILARLIDAAESGLVEELNKLSGRFCLILQAAAGARAYGDSIGARSIFHSLSDRSCVASHAGLLASHLGAVRSRDAEAFIRTGKYRALSVKYLPGDMTMYEDVVPLPPNNSFAFGGGLERYWPARHRRENGIQELLTKCEAYFEGLARSLVGRPVFIGITGGIDTRLLLAGMSRRDLDIRGMTWLGSYHDPSERPIIEAIVERMGLENAYVDLPGPANETAAISGRNSGGYRGNSRLTSAIEERLDDLGRAVFLRGYGGEVMRGFYNLLKEPLRDGSPDELVRVYAQKSRVKGPDPVFDRVVEAAFRSWTERAGYDDALAGLGYDINDIFYWEQRMGVWGAAMHNEMDAAMLSMTGLNDRAMFDLAYGLPRNARLKKSLFAGLIETMEPRLGGLPVA